MKVIDSIQSFKESDEFRKFEIQISGFNFFEAVGIERMEIRHSAFLKFLPDPKGEHRFKDAFLSKFLLDFGFLMGMIEFENFYVIY
ncbi:MAG: PD-(D/E)XK nuclease family protein [Thermoleophilia bacterium]